MFITHPPVERVEDRVPDLPIDELEDDAPTDNVRNVHRVALRRERGRGRGVGRGGEREGEGSARVVWYGALVDLARLSLACLASPCLVPCCPSLFFSARKTRYMPPRLCTCVCDIFSFFFCSNRCRHRHRGGDGGGGWQVEEEVRKLEEEGVPSSRVFVGGKVLLR